MRFLIFLLWGLFSWGTLFAQDESTTNLKEDEIKVTVNEDKLYFQWRDATRCAFVKVKESWWLIFDKKAGAYSIPKNRDLPPGIIDIKILFDYPSTSDITLFEIKVHDSYEINFFKEAGQWVIESLDTVKKNVFLSKKEDPKQKRKDQNRRRKAATLKFENKNWPGFELYGLPKHTIVNIDDPKLNNFFTFVLSADYDQGLPKPYECPYYATIISLQGAGLVRTSDEILLNDEKILKGLIFNGPPPLKVDQVYDAEKDIQFKSQVSIFTNVPKDDMKIALDEMKKEHKDGILHPFHNLTRAWAELIVGNKFFAMPFLDLAVQYYPGLDHHPFTRSLRGIINLLNRNFERANTDLSFLPNTLEVKIFRAILLSATGVPRSQLNDLRRLLFFCKNYAQTLHEEFLLLGLMAILDAGDYPTIIDIEKVKPMQESKNVTLFYRYAIAKSGLKQGLFSPEDLRRSIWNTNEVFSQLKAYITLDIALMDLNSGKKQVPLKDTISQIRQAQHLWRGTYFEFRALNEIVDLYIQNKMFVDALKTLKNMQQLFPQMFLDLHVDKKMEVAFNTFFKESYYKKESPLRVINMFDEFKEYSPDNEDGENIIRIIGDVLIDLDLLDHAAELLSKESMRENSSQALTQAYLKIAQIHINNLNGEAALSILSKIPKSQQSENAAKITHLTADAYDTLDDLEKALQILDDDKTSESANHAIEILIARKKWKDAKDRIFRLILQLEKEKDDDGKMKNILRLAMINVITEDNQDNEALRAVYKDFVKTQNDEQQKTFNYLTDSSDVSVITRPIIEDTLDGIKNFMFLLDKYGSKNKEN
ncbi:MAG: hypothetical protein NEHIOOID_00890 [Holosporales bacterium]